jgi:NAD(P)-dependent dehydrogenase (short-subunit alcohol dehydrogenase family)
MPNEQKLSLVTGASRGIGNAIARSLLDRGYAVACGYRHQRKEALMLVEKYPRAYPIGVDIHDRASVRKAVAAIQRHYKRTIDVIVNNAAIADERPFESITDADWDRVLETNLRGPFIVAQEILPSMVEKRWGRIVNIVSIGGQWGGMRQVHYAAAKAGLINFTQSLARLYSSHGITSNAVSPGLVGTDMASKELRTKAGRAKLAAIPIGRIATTAEIAAAVAFLCSEEASYITGQTINVNGGMLF